MQILQFFPSILLKLSILQNINKELCLYDSNYMIEIPDVSRGNPHGRMLVRLHTNPRVACFQPTSCFSGDASHNAIVAIVHCSIRGHLSKMSVSDNFY